MTTTDLPAVDLRNGTLAALRLIETGPRAVYCTACFAQPEQPCRGLDRGTHQERGWMLRNNLVATLRHHLELPTTGPAPEATAHYQEEKAS